MKHLEEGRPATPSSRWRKRIKNAGRLALLVGVLSISITLMPLFQIFTVQNKSLDPSCEDYPFVLLRDFRANGADNQGVLDQSQYYGLVESSWNLLSARWYRVSEWQRVPEGISQGGNQSGSVSLNTRLYQLKLKVFAERLFQDLIREYGEIEAGQAAYMESVHPGFDKLVVYEQGDVIQIYAIASTNVIHVNYRGPVEQTAGVEGLLDLMAGKIKVQ